MYRHAVIDQATLVVRNVVKWDGEAQWAPPAGCFVIQSDVVDIGDIYDPSSKKFYKPEVLLQPEQ